MKIKTPYIKKIIKRLAITFASLLVLLFLLNWVFPVPAKIEYSTIITDDKSEVIHAFLTKDQQWRMKTELDEISPLLRKTIVEKEDKYFYRHPGINIVAMGRAFIKNLFRMKRTSGASTITMQVARALEPKKRTYGNKCIEIFRAFQLEWKYSKVEILQMYLNLVPYGGNIEGVKSDLRLSYGSFITALTIGEGKPSLFVRPTPVPLVSGWVIFTRWCFINLFEFLPLGGECGVV